MLYYNFNNYEEFKELFGLVKHGNGVKSRKNKILLSFIKNRKLLHDAVVSGDYSLLHISDMATMKNLVTNEIIKSSNDNMKLSYVVDLMGKRYYSSTYSTDGNKGLCEDGDTRAVRYINMENGERVFKMKAGKFYRAIVLQTEFGKLLPEQVMNYLCEEFASEWQVYTMGQLPKNRLYVNNEFHKIYSSECCDGNFGSCMVDKDRSSFYENAVKASAAYLENEDGMVIARCIIFNEVKDQDGKIWRLAERQYSSESNEILKRALIEALISGGYIDGYKKVGAGCGDARAFVDINEHSLSDRRFSIECKLDWEDTLSYQDSFKCYDMDKMVADNFGAGNLDLGITDDCLENSKREYDDYHGYYCNETVLVYVGGTEYYCDADDLDDFIWVDSIDEYHHKDDVQRCPECGKYFVTSDGRYSEVTEETYCTYVCLDDAESTYKRENWYYSYYDEEYYENEEDITYFYEWNSGLGEYERKTISERSADELWEKGELHRFGNDLFDLIDNEFNLPFGYQLIKIAV